MYLGEATRRGARPSELFRFEIFIYSTLSLLLPLLWSVAPVLGQSNAPRPIESNNGMCMCVFRGATGLFRCLPQPTAFLFNFSFANYLSTADRESSTASVHAKTTTTTPKIAVAGCKTCEPCACTSEHTTAVVKRIERELYDFGIEIDAVILMSGHRVCVCVWGVQSCSVGVGGEMWYTHCMPSYLLLAEGEILKVEP